MRATDVIGRLGGEEFAAIIPGNAAEAGLVAERLRAAFQAAGVVISGHEIGATVSIGIATATRAGRARCRCWRGRTRRSTAPSTMAETASNSTSRANQPRPAPPRNSAHWAKPVAALR